MSYIEKREQTFDSLFFVRALPNEYLVLVGRKKLQISLGGTAFRLFRRHLKVPASAEITSFELECSTSNYLGVIVSGYVAWRIDPNHVETAIRSLDFYNAENPLFKTSQLICDMAKDAVRRSIAEIKVSEILNSSEKLKSSIEGILKDVEKWGLTADTIGINRIFIKSENVYNELQAEERDKLRLISDTSRQKTEALIRQESIEQEKTVTILQNELKETQIREELKQKRLQEESEIEKMRLLKEKEREEIRLSQELEKNRFAYQRERADNDFALQTVQYEIDKRNLELTERKRQAEGGLNDREFTELVVQKLEKMTGLYKNSNLTVIGDKADAMNAIVAPIQVLTDLVKQFVTRDKTPLAEKNREL